MTAVCVIFRYAAAIGEDSERILHDYRYYVVPFAYAGYINSVMEYTVVYLMQVIMLLAFYSKGTILVIFFFYLGGTFYNPFVKLANDLTTEFKKMSSEIERNRVQNSGNFEQYSVLFCQRCISYLEDYRKLLRWVL